MRRRLSLVLQLFLLPLPWGVRRRLLVILCGYEIDATARIGLSLVAPDRLVMRQDSRIGHLTLARGLAAIRLEKGAALGHLNWISGFPREGERYFRAFPARDPSLVIGEHGAIVHRNLIDCTDRVSIGAFALVAGNRNQILTHSIDLATGNQACAPVTVGRHCFVGTGTILLKGSVLPDCCVLAAGSVLNAAHTAPYRLLSGVPAAAVRDLAPDLAFFHRTRGESD
ncbi:acyltransferase [Ensifer soli]|uniref:acyltransferase n=1 Tax=Ciceribacter sp. sgz301302 TaxID=3342379 RepID=UPI0035B932D3